MSSGARDYSLYFELTEGVGGQYAKQAWLGRSAAEVDEWLNRCAGVAAPLWAQLARRCVDLEAPEERQQDAAGDVSAAERAQERRAALFVANGLRQDQLWTLLPDSGEDCESSEAPLSMVEAMLGVHLARYRRDNLSDVWFSLEQLAEQAGYIWFTREIEAQLGHELPLKDPHRLDGGLDNRLGGAQLDVHGKFPKRRMVTKASLQPLRVVHAAQQYAYSKQNALLALNLLLFEVIRFEPRDRGKGVSAEQTSIAFLLRRVGGPASLFPMCVLYAELAARLGVQLDIVHFAPPQMLRGRGPEFLLRLAGGDDEQQELFIDIQAQGRLRAPHDLARFMHDSCPPAALKTAILQSFVMPLSMADSIVQQLYELEWVCEASDEVAEAAFWRVQRDIFVGQRAKHERGRDVDERAPEGGGNQ